MTKDNLSKIIQRQKVAQEARIFWQNLLDDQNTLSGGYVAKVRKCCSKDHSLQILKRLF